MRPRLINTPVEPVAASQLLSIAAATLISSRDTCALFCVQLNCAQLSWVCGYTYPDLCTYAWIVGIYNHMDADRQHMVDDGGLIVSLTRILVKLLNQITLMHQVDFVNM